jgi:hypothetical protein
MKISKSLAARANDVVAIAQGHHPHPLVWREWFGKNGPTGGFLIYERKAPTDSPPLFWIDLRGHRLLAPREPLESAKEIASYLEKETGHEISIELQS